MKANYESVLHVNLNLLESNFKFYKKKLGSSTKIIAVVKAFAYGHGDIKICKELEKLNVSYFWVADFEEAVRIRRNNISTPIIVANPGYKNYNLFIKYDLEPLIFNFKSLDYFNQNKMINCHIKFNTGMNRFGFETNQKEKVINFLNQNKNINVKTICSHLADSTNEPFTKNQMNNFDFICDYFMKNYHSKIERHLFNSKATIKYKNKYELVRLGIGLFGVTNNKGLHQISTMTSVVSQIKIINQGEFVGYGMNYCSKERVKIGIIPFGYADGIYEKKNSDNYYVFIKNNKYKVIGDISMDSLAVNLENSKIEEGDKVILFDSNYTIKEIAKSCNTSEYEMLSKLNRRIKREYYS
tara:strand:+ start:671 stop:1735 length:1065 start_codon:yes stop_codon:yes gene_type:complete